MKLGVMQPYFMPYIGYFQLIKAVDKYIVYDDVSFINRGWINRNNILINGQKKLFTITLNGASQNKLINEITISDDFIKLKKTIQMSYSKAPFFNEIIKLLDNIFCFQNKQLALFVTNSLNVVCDYLNINTDIILSSDIEKDNSLNYRDKILNLCKIFDAKEYINSIGGQELYNKEDFENNEVKLYFLDSNITEYKQFKNSFISYLSMIDILMFNSVEEVNSMLDEYTLI